MLLSLVLVKALNEACLLQLGKCVLYAVGSCVVWEYVGDPLVAGGASAVFKVVKPVNYRVNKCGMG